MMNPELRAQAEDMIRARALRRTLKREESLKAMYEADPVLRSLDTRIRTLTSQAMLNRVFFEDGENTPPEDPSGELADLYQKRAALLAAAGGESAGHPDCPQCADTGIFGGDSCECVRRLVTQLQRGRLESEADIGAQCFQRFKLSLFSPEPLGSESDYSPRELMIGLREEAEEYADTFGAHNRDLLLVGGVGTGKTFLASCILGAVSDAGWWAEYETVIRFLQTMEAEQFGREPPGRGAARYFNCDLLLLDDLGTEFLTPFAQAALYDLINTRLSQKRRTIVTSNYTREQIKARYLPQTASRLCAYEILPFAGDDLRMKGV